MLTETDEVLFVGRRAYAGLSNQEQLVRECPEEFINHNAWSEYAMALFHRRLDVGSLRWPWRSGDHTLRDRQIECFNAVLAAFGLNQEHKKALAGWMLSRIVISIPEPIFVPSI